MISSLDKLHYSFCGDLGDKGMVDSEWPTKLDFSLFKVKQTMGGGGIDVFDDGKLFIPGLYKVQKVGQDFWSVLTEKEYQTFIAPADYYADGKLFYEFQKQLFIPIPNEIFQHPHLPTHSTFQFYFLNNSLFTANLPYLDVGDFQNNGSKQMRVHWGIKANPSGTYVTFRSNHIFFKWKIEVRQGIVNMNLVKVAIDGISKTISAGAKAIGKFFGIDATESQEAQKEIVQNLIGRDRGKDFMEREKSQRNQELQTARMFQSTLQYTGDNPIEPSVFYANTVKFPYNLFDYWLRTEEKAFICRWYYSNNLLNNLIHNNDANPITYTLDITSAKLANILRLGYWKGELISDYDPNNKMSECFARGITFYKDKKEHFTNPNLGVKEAVTQIQYSSFCTGSNYTAQAITEGGEGLTIDIPYEADQRGYSHTTYVSINEPVAQDNFKNALVTSTGCQENNLHYYSTTSLEGPRGFCWGCTYDELKRVGFLNMKWTATMNCYVNLKLDVNANTNTGAGCHSFHLKAGVEYQVTISEDQFIFKTESTTRIEWQKQPTNDDFSQLDWSPPSGSGGEIEIPLEDPEISLPEPGEGDPTPEPDFPVDPFDPTGGEPEITPIEPDLPPDIDPGIDPEPEVPEPEVPEPEIPEPDLTPDQDPEGEPDISPPDPFDPDDDPDGD